MQSQEYKRPVRPPRSSKASKETATHLLRIIGTLSASHDSTDKDKEIKKLEIEFNDSDRKLSRLVERYQNYLTCTMQSFSKISTKLTASEKVCHTTKEKLCRSKKLLYCKHTESKQLWLEVVEHKQILDMLKEIEVLVGASSKIDMYIKSRMYLKATELVVNSITALEGSLDSVEALKELRTELCMKKEQLHNLFLEELHNYLYLSSTSDIMRYFKRHGSGRFRRNLDTSNSSDSANSSGNSLDESALMDDSGFLDDSVTVTKELMATVVECIFLLNRIPETIEFIKDRCHQELMTIIRHSAKHLTETFENVACSPSHHSLLNSVPCKEYQDVLMDLLELVFDQCRSIMHNHMNLIENLEELHHRKDESQPYDIDEIWSKLQSVLEIFLGEYMDIHNSSSVVSPATSQSFSKMPVSMDIATFFSRKRAQKDKYAYSLFKFDCSSHAMNLKTYLQEQKKEIINENRTIDVLEADTQIFICPPSVTNIAVVYMPLTKFISELEQELNLKGGANSPLHSFVSSCVRVYLGHISVEVTHLIDGIAKSLENFEIVADPDKLKDLGAATSLLKSGVLIDISLKELLDVLYALPEYSNHFLNIVCNMLQNYKDLCTTAYSNIVEPQLADRKVMSSTWARDSDISRLLRSLPNWKILKKENEGESLDFEESPEDIRLRNKKESELLIDNHLASTQTIHSDEILDPQQLHNLGILHETMEWLSLRISSFINDLTKKPKESSEEYADSENVITFEKPPEEIVKSLNDIQSDYSDLADMCLLILHLEPRFHCIYYLHPLASQGNYAIRVDNQEADPEVVKLTAGLYKIDESLQLVLEQRKMRYIFEGLGELISTILFSSANKIKRINDNGVKKISRNIYTLQHALANITTSRELSLDRVRQYYELLYHTPEEILNLIVDTGPQFATAEYMVIIQLLHSSQHGSKEEVLTHYVYRLKEIMNEVSVSV